MKTLSLYTFLTEVCRQKNQKIILAHLVRTNSRSVCCRTVSCDSNGSGSARPVAYAVFRKRLRWHELTGHVGIFAGKGTGRNVDFSVAVRFCVSGYTNPHDPVAPVSPALPAFIVTR